MNNQKLILIVEDEKPICKFITVSLKAQGYKCIDTQNGKTAISMVASYNPDVIILDLGLPDIDGLDVISEIREFSRTPIIIVSARGQDNEKVEALDMGADDYLTKPFSVVELLARIRVAIRHSEMSDLSPDIISNFFVNSELNINFTNREIIVRNEEVHLTPLEFKIMELMIKNRGKVLTHNYILKEVWGNYINDDKKSLRVFMANLRRKIEKDPADPKFIMTEVGVGYRFKEE